MSNSQAHITTISQTSITECGRRNQSTASAARLMHQTVEIAMVWAVVKPPCESRDGRRSCQAVTTKTQAAVATSAAAMLVRIAASIEAFVLSPPFPFFDNA